jgi:hypothetical protein
MAKTQVLGATNSVIQRSCRSSRTWNIGVDPAPENASARNIIATTVSSPWVAGPGRLNVVSIKVEANVRFLHVEGNYGRPEGHIGSGVTETMAMKTFKYHYGNEDFIDEIDTIVAALADVKVSLRNGNLQEAADKLQKVRDKTPDLWGHMQMEEVSRNWKWEPGPDGKLREKAKV